MIVKRHQESVSATALGRMMVCERQMLLDAKRGQKISRERAVAIERGNRVHEAVYQRGHQPVSSAAGGKDRRCFVASAVYGPDAGETEALRSFRDRVLMGSAIGRVFVGVYYRVSPWVAQKLEGRPALSAGVRQILNVFVRVVK